jgi:formylglycine-generating enzyme required for sulfatase activity
MNADKCKNRLVLAIMLLALSVGCQPEPASTFSEEELGHPSDTPIAEKPAPKEMAQRPTPEPQFDGKPLDYWVAESKNVSAESRRAAADALGNLGLRAIPALTVLLQDKDLGVRLAAALALKKIRSGKKPNGISPAERPLSRLLALDLGGDVAIELLLIRPGSFLMGDADGRDNAKAVHRVTITKAFYLGKCEVTQEQWQAVMGANPSRFQGAKNPVDNVGWEDCRAFLKKLDEKFASTGVKFSLPSEAQWEYACRAGSTAKYCYGDDESRFAEYAWYGDNSGGRTHPVGEKKPNAWGLYDMHGNLLEWCADWYDPGYYQSSPASDPTGPATGTSHVDRGGSWDSPARGCRSFFRNSNSPRPDDNIGLRVACVKE